MNKQYVIDTYSGILFGLKKGNPVTCHNIDGPCRHYTEQKKPVTKGQTLCEIPLI